MLLYVLLALACGCSLVAEAKMQNVTVTGTTVCNKRALGKVLVELWEHDSLDPNDLLATIHTGTQGEFSISGEEDEITSIDPFIRISHVCNLPQGKDNCKRVFELEVPKDKINNGVYDHTFIILDTMYKGEKLEC